MKRLQLFEVDGQKKNQRDACLEITFTVILKRGTFFFFRGIGGVTGALNCG